MEQTLVELRFVIFLEGRVPFKSRSLLRTHTQKLMEDRKYPEAHTWLSLGALRSPLRTQKQGFHTSEVEAPVKTVISE